MFDLGSIAALPEGADRTAALAEWVQSLYQGHSIPVLVGGAAAELYTRGAYVTGDLDFVGSVPPRVAAQLERAGFAREGRHWIHEALQVFVEFPASDLAEGERAVRLTVGRATVVVVGLEEILVDRLAAWEFWDSEVDGAAALRIWQVRHTELDAARLAQLARRSEVTAALERLQVFVTDLADRDPTPDELARWSRRGSR